MWRKASKTWKWARGVQEQGGGLAQLEGSMLGGGQQCRQHRAYRPGGLLSSLVRGTGSTAAGSTAAGHPGRTPWQGHCGTGGLAMTCRDKM